jgi:D-alanine-D-alanine ligase
MKHVLLLAGGDSGERGVSLKSGESVRKALIKGGYTVTVFDPIEGFDVLQEKLRDIDIVFPALHGEGGEDGVIQEFLEQQDIPFVGAGSEASRLCFDKWAYKEHLLANKFPCPNGILVDSDSFWDNPLSHQPFVLKPYDGGSSIDTFVVRDPMTMDTDAIRDALDRYDRMLIEELIIGVETTVAVLGDTALPMVEIIPPSNEEFDYENKYNGKTQELCPPAHVSPKIQIQAAKLAQDIHQSTGCKDMSRTDIIVTPHGMLYVLETNTIPGLTDQSLLPKAALAGGLTMPQLVETLVKSAV